jgi:hypothetical protein
MNETVGAVLPYLVLFFVVLLMARRLKRPRQLRPKALWIFPVVFVGLSCWYAQLAFLHGPRLSFYDELTIAAAALGGVAMGSVRASMVKLELVDGKIWATLSVWGLGFLVFWMLGRTLLRQLGYTSASTPYGLFTDGLLAFATASICARSFVLARRCRKLQPATRNLI